MATSKALRKLASDILAERKVLGLAFTAKHLYALARNVNAVRKHRVIAAAESGIHDRFDLTFYGHPLQFDCGLVSGPNESPMTFFRELFIRNMYFRYLDMARIPLNACLDVGANQLIVSYVLSCLSEGKAKILALEPQESPNWAYRNHILAGQYGIVWEKAFVVPHGEDSLPALLVKHRMAQIDYAKFDIEGSEYGVFTEASWLAKVSNLSMELHPVSGDNAIIAAALTQHGFSALFCDKWGQPSDTAQAEFLYASKTGHLLSRPQSGADVLSCTRIERRPLLRSRWGGTS